VTFALNFQTKNVSLKCFPCSVILQQLADSRFSSVRFRSAINFRRTFKIIPVNKRQPDRKRCGLESGACRL